MVVARRVGRLRLLGEASVFSRAFDTDEVRYSAGGGAVLTLSKHLTLSSDAVTLVDRGGAALIR